MLQELIILIDKFPYTKENWWNGNVLDYDIAKIKGLKAIRCVDTRTYRTVSASELTNLSKIEICCIDPICSYKNNFSSWKEIKEYLLIKVKEEMFNIIIYIN